MGLLTIDGLQTLDYKSSKKHQKKLKKGGLLQLIQLLKKFGQIQTKFDTFPKFGYEIEGHMLQVVPNQSDPNKSTYQLQLDTDYVKKSHGSFFVVEEFGKWMVEVIPSAPFDAFIGSSVLLTQIKQTFSSMRSSVMPNDRFLSFALPPKLGTLDYPQYLSQHSSSGLTHQDTSQNNGSLLAHDSMINTHPRFPTLANNNAQRRDCLEIFGPLYQDERTDMDTMLPGEKCPGQIYLDSYIFGPGLCSLQVTVGVKDLSEARWLYDQFHIFTPLFLSLSASMPFYKGRLLDTDTRWEFLCQAIDGRNHREKLPGALTRRRHGPAGFFLSEDTRNRKEYNDSKRTLNKWARKFLKQQAKVQQVELDSKLLDHFSFLFVRDYLCVFAHTVEHELDLSDTKLFEGMQSSNWNDVRLKPPPSLDSDIGWRVEFRSMDVQLLPEQNFLFTHAIQLLSRILIQTRQEINFYIPITQVDDNFVRANSRGAACQQRFHFRTNIFSSGPAVVEELTLKEIFEGKVRFLSQIGFLHLNEQRVQTVLGAMHRRTGIRNQI